MSSQLAKKKELEKAKKAKQIVPKGDNPFSYTLMGTSAGAGPAEPTPTGDANANKDNATIGNLRSRILKVQTDLEKALADVAKERQEKNTYASNWQAAQGDKRELRKKIAALEEKIEDLEDQADVWMEQLTEAGLTGESNEELQENNDDLRTAVDHLTAKNDQLEQDHATLQSTVGVLQQYNGELQNNMNELQQNNNGLQNAVNELQRNNNGLQNTVNDLKQNNNGLQNAVGVLQQNNGELQNTINELQRNNNGLQNTVGVLQQTNGELQISMNDLEQNNNGLQNTVSVLQQNNGELQYTVDELRKQISELKDQRNTEATRDHNEIAELRDESDKRQKEITRLENDIKKLNDDLTYKTQCLASKDTDSNHNAQWIASLQQQLEAKEEELQKQFSAIADIQSTIDKLNADINRWEKACNQARQQSDAWQLQHQESEAKLASLRAEFDWLKGQNDELEAATDELPHLTTTIDELNDAVEQKGDEIEQMKHEIEVKDDRIQRLEAELQKAMAANLASTGSTNAVSESLEDEISAIGEDLGPEPVDMADTATQTDSESRKTVVMVDSTSQTQITTPSPVEAPCALLSISSITTIMDDAPRAALPAPSPPAQPLGLSRITTFIASPPIATQITSSTPAKAPRASLAFSSITTLIDDAPRAARPAPIVIATSKPSPLARLLPFLAFLLLCSTIYCYLALRAWRTANLPTAARTTSGAFGTSSHFLGIVPLGWSVGEGVMGESMARMGAAVFQGVEKWAEVDRGYYV